MHTPASVTSFRGNLGSSWANEQPVEQPVAWALGALEGDADFASVTLSPAPGASYLKLRGATPLPEFGNGKYRVRIDPPLAGYNDSWRTVEVAAGDTPADIVLFSAALEPAIAYTVTFEARNVGWHWASAWFLAEMGVQPTPRWIGHWGRVRRVFDAVRAKIVYAVTGVAGVLVSHKSCVERGLVGGLELGLGGGASLGGTQEDEELIRAVWR